LKKAARLAGAPPRISRKPAQGGREHFFVRGFAEADSPSYVQHKLPFCHEWAEHATAKPTILSGLLGVGCGCFGLRVASRNNNSTYEGVSMAASAPPQAIVSKTPCLPRERSVKFLTEIAIC